MSLKNRITLLTLALFLLGIWSVTLYAARSLRQDMVHLLGSQQFTTVTTVADQIQNELSNGMATLTQVASKIDPELLADRARLQSVLESHAMHMGLFNGGIRIASAKGKTIATVPFSPERIGADYSDRDYMVAALKEGKAFIGKPVIGRVLRAPVLGLAVPIRSRDGTIIAALVGAINLGETSFFEKSVTSRYGQTGGFLLFAPQHQLIVTGTDKSRAMTAMPAAGLNAMNDRYAAGYEGYGVAISSRGVEELSAAKRIPIAGWYLVGILPTAEAFAPMDALQRRMLTAALLISLVVGAVVWWVAQRMLTRRFAPMLSATETLSSMSHAGGEVPQPLAIHRADEIGHLIAAFNALIISVVQREQALRQSEGRYRALSDRSPLAIQVFAPDGSTLRVNAAWERLWNTPGAAMTDYNVLQDAQLEAIGILVLLRRAFAGEDVDFPEHCYTKPNATGASAADGLWLRAFSYPLFDANGKVVEVVLVQEDVTANRQAQEQLRRAANVFLHAREGIVVTTADATIIDTNEAFTRITGFSHEEALGRKPNLLRSGRQSNEFYQAMWQQLNQVGHWSGEIWNRRKSGEIYPELLTISCVRDAHGAPQHFIGLFSDITTQKTQQDALEHIAHFDTLTGLPNRVLLGDRLRQAMVHTQRRGLLLGVVYIDLDGFKTINDRHGHETGDFFLSAVAQRMKHTLREGDTIARLGGDEFVVILMDLAERKSAEPLLERLLACAAEPVHVGEVGLCVSASMGVTFFPQSDDADADLLLRQADQAMYQAKLAGKNHFHYFDLDQDRDLRGRHQSIERIRHALQNNEFVLYYQPKVHMRTGTVVGAEALIRWQHPDLGLLAPLHFLPTIEDHPLSVDLGEWVIATALQQIGVWQEQGLCIPVSVNVGARQLQQPDFVQRLELLTRACPQVAPSQLQIEVLETSALHDVEQVSAVIQACQRMGIEFALDDFGTGYSSLTYLKRLPARVLKIDRSFVYDMLDDADDLAILEGVLGLATAFTRETIAEGVETHAHGELLLQLGCDLGQGFGIARPMAADALPPWMAQWQPPASWVNAQRLARDDLPGLYAVIEHRAWVRQLVAYLEGAAPHPPELDVHLCRFGLWLGSAAVDTLHTHNLRLEPMVTVHQRMHQLASALVGAHATGNAAGVSEGLAQLACLLDEMAACLLPRLPSA